MPVKFTYLPEINNECMPEINDAIQKTIASSSYIGGDGIRRFEETFAKYTNADDCCACSSGSSALHLAIDTMMQEKFPTARHTHGLEKRFVITTPISFIATTEAIVNAGLIPVMANVDMSGNIDTASVEELLTNYDHLIAGIVFTNMYGHVADRTRLRYSATTHGVFLIEDAAQSFGVSGLGQIADISCVSFNPVKNLGAMGDAGALFGNSDRMAVARSVREHGVVGKNIFNRIGFNYRMDNMQANILMAKLPYLSGWNEHRHNVAKMYDDAIGGYFYERPTPAETVYHLYNVLVDHRDAFMSSMKMKGIDVRTHYQFTIPNMKTYDAPSLITKYPKQIGHNQTPISALRLLHHLKMNGDNPYSPKSGEMIADKNVSLPIPFGEGWEDRVNEVITAIKECGDARIQ